MKKITLFLILTVTILTAGKSFARNSARNIIHVNRMVTTHIVMPESIKLVDISTEEIIGNQCADNMVRLKPVLPESVTDGKPLSRGDFLGTVTMIGERHVAQYDIMYEPDPSKAVSMYRVDYAESIAYNNPEIGMPESEMARLAWTAYGSRRKFHNIRTGMYGISAEVYNIYSVGNYFFIDFCLKNHTRIPYDISEMRITLSDKKESKATNFQTIELTPAFVLNPAKSFKKGFRQVIVLEKLTFPNDKVLNIEISENQISGRVISLPLRYEDILNADCFDMDKAEQIKDSLSLKSSRSSLQRKYDSLLKENSSLKDKLKKSDKELKSLRSKLESFSRSVTEVLK